VNEKRNRKGDIPFSFSFSDITRYVTEFLATYAQDALSMKEILEWSALDAESMTHGVSTMAINGTVYNMDKHFYLTEKLLYNL
jgi:hypothetical protein